jgi:hypothetical protein
MRHFHRCHLDPVQVLELADGFFAELGLEQVARSNSSRTYKGSVGSPEVPAVVKIAVRAEGGHYTFVEAVTDQVGESRVDRNVKRFFVQLHRVEEPSHRLGAAY